MNTSNDINNFVSYEEEEARLEVEKMMLKVEVALIERKVRLEKKKVIQEVIKALYFGFGFTYFVILRLM